jgi:hypothetical protein
MKHSQDSLVTTLRILFLATLLGIAAAHLPQAKTLYASFFDRFDTRPAVTVLFLGNSRTYVNDMPAMIRPIADSAHSPNKYLVTMYAQPGARLKDLWNDPAVQDLLKQKWNYVVLQGASGEQLDDAANRDFLGYGTLLADAIKQSGATPVLLVTWRFDKNYVPQLAPLWPRFYDMIQSGYYALAARTGAATVNVGRVWEQLAAASSLPLTTDGNHPTVRASYFIALMFYRFFSHDDLTHVRYVPDGVDADDAKLLKTFAQRP